MKTWWGDAVSEDNQWGYDYLPKLDKLYDLMQAVEMMHNGQMTGYIAQGFNILASAPNKKKVTEGLAKLKFLVVMDPLKVETGEFWKPQGEFHEVDPSKIMTEVFRLPTTCFAEERGSLVSSSRVLQWHWQGAEGPGQTRSDLDIMAGLYLRIRKLYKDEGGSFPDPILNLTWNCSIPRMRPSCWSRKASNCRPSPSCATTVRPPAAAGSSPAAGRRPATRWDGATTATRPASATR